MNDKRTANTLINKVLANGGEPIPISYNRYLVRGDYLSYNDCEYIVDQNSCYIVDDEWLYCIEAFIDEVASYL